MFPEIHIFFDFEGHLPEKSLDSHCEIIYEMLSFFNEETDHGKLWISYPMAEALKHTYKDFEKCFDCIQNINENIRYKEKVGKINDFQDLRYYTNADWYHIITTNIRKAICLVNCDYSMLAFIELISALDQIPIFDAQKKRFILTDSKVVVLSSFPLFLLYYFGEKLYDKIHFDDFDKKCKFKHIADDENTPESILV
jgi:hypothetical protein